MPAASLRSSSIPADLALGERAGLVRNSVMVGVVRMAERTPLRSDSTCLRVAALNAKQESR